MVYSGWRIRNSIRSVWLSFSSWWQRNKILKGVCDQRTPLKFGLIKQIFIWLICIQYWTTPYPNLKVTRLLRRTSTRRTKEVVLWFILLNLKVVCRSSPLPTAVGLVTSVLAIWRLIWRLIVNLQNFQNFQFSFDSIAFAKLSSGRLKSEALWLYGWPAFAGEGNLN